MSKLFTVRFGSSVYYFVAAHDARDFALQLNRENGLRGIYWQNGGWVVTEA